MSDDTRSTIYVADSSALIDIHRDLPESNFPVVWNKLDELCYAGRLIAPTEVRHEIERSDDTLSAWVKKRPFIFREIDGRQVEHLKVILGKFPELVHVRGKKEFHADSIVVALALALKEEDSSNLFPTEVVVLQHELHRKSPNDVAKLPDACSEFGLSHVRYLRMVQLEGWVFE